MKPSPDTGDQPRGVPSRGFVLAASGPSYVTLAVQTARSLRQQMPDIPVDLFTDGDVPEGVFSEVHRLEKSWFRPKFESLIRSRFDLTVYLDVDIVVVADISDVFELLERVDMVAAHVQNRNQTYARRPWRKPIPNAFPQINGGLMGIRKPGPGLDLIEEAKQVMEAEGLKQDQPVLRELLYDSTLRLAILPPEYNARSVQMWRSGSSNLTAPRVLHNSKFQSLMKDDATPPPMWRIYGPFFLRHLQNLIAADRTLNPDSRLNVLAPDDIGGRLGRALSLRWLRGK